MITDNGRIKCDECGKFMVVPFWSWTEYGSSFDTEPPDPQHCHTACFNRMSPRSKEHVTSSVWIKAHLIDGK